MPDALSGLEWVTSPQAPLVLAIRLTLAFALGGAVAQIYRRTRPPSTMMNSFPGTLVLLAILIAMVTLVIGDSVARAFGLVGALSIVRFRTVVRDTQDTAFVIFSVVVGMAAGAGNLWVAGLGLAVVAAAAFLVRDDIKMPTQAPVFELRLRVALGQDLSALLAAALDPFLVERRLRGIQTVKQGIALDLTYDITMNPDRSPDDLVRTLNRIEGVQEVDLHRQNNEETS